MQKKEVYNQKIDVAQIAFGVSFLEMLVGVAVGNFLGFSYYVFYVGLFILFFSLIGSSIGGAIGKRKAGTRKAVIIYAISFSFIALVLGYFFLVVRSSMY